MTVVNELHGIGAVLVLDTCFNKLTAGVAALTNTVAEAVLPVPPLVDEAVTVLVYTPAVVPVIVI